MKANACLFLERPGTAKRVGEQIETRRDDLRRPERTRSDELLAAVQRREIDVRQVDGRPLTGRGGVARFTVNLNVAGAAAVSTWQNFDVAVEIDAASQRGTGDDRTEAFHREDTVDR